MVKYGKDIAIFGDLGSEQINLKDDKGDKTLKNRPSKIFGRSSSTNFTRSILEYFEIL